MRKLSARRSSPALQAQYPLRKGGGQHRHTLIRQVDGTCPCLGLAIQGGPLADQFGGVRDVNADLEKSALQLAHAERIVVVPGQRAVDRENIQACEVLSFISCCFGVTRFY